MESFSSSVASILERIEIIRSSLRWVSYIDRAGIQNILRQVNILRDEILFFSRVERCKENVDILDADISADERRKALSERHFIFDGVFGNNEDLLEVFEIAEKASRTDMPVLIQGESGTGKELLAKVIHANSRRSDSQLISVNCGAITPTLLESELFGHVKGSFTGSVKDRKGKFESADKGTIFLDEIGELAPESQVKLLRVLQNGEIQRIGADEEIFVNTRIIAATNRNLYEMVKNREFREDLYYRLSVICVTLPPLRERQDEIFLLIDFFCTEAAEKLNRPPVKLSPKLRNFLLNYSFPGNIRELRNIIYRVSCLSDKVADIKHLPENIRPSSWEIFEEIQMIKDFTLDEVRNAAKDKAEKLFLKEKLRELGGNVTLLAKQLDMNRSHIQSLLKKHGIHAKDFKIRKKSS